MGKLLVSIILGGIIFFEGNPVLAVTKTVTQADSTTFTITVESVGGYSGTVTLSASGCPTNATCVFSPNPVSVPVVGGSVDSTMTVTTSATGLTPTGTYTIGVDGTDNSNNVSRVTEVTLIVNSLIPCTVSPSSLDVQSGGTGNFTETHAGYSYNWNYQGREPSDGGGAAYTIPTCGNYSGATTNSLVTWATGTSPVGSTCDVRVKVTSGNAWNTCRAQAAVVAPTPLPDLIPWNFSACYQLNQTNPNYVDVFVNASEKNIGQAAVSGSHAGIVYVTSTDPQCSNYVRTYPPGPSSLPVDSSAVLLSNWRADGYPFAGNGWTLSCAQGGTLYSNLSVNSYGVGIEESDFSNNAQQLDSLPACGPLITPTPTPTPTPVVCTEPVAPSGGFTDNATVSSLRLNWTDNSTDESVFEIFRGGIYLTEVGANIIQQNDPGLSFCTTYIYKVRARKDAAGSCSTLYSTFTPEFSGTTTGCGGTPTPTPTVVVTSTPTPTPAVTVTPTATPVVPTPFCEYGLGLGIFATPNPVCQTSSSNITLDKAKILNCTNPGLATWFPPCGNFVSSGESGAVWNSDNCSYVPPLNVYDINADVPCDEGVASCFAPVEVINCATPTPTATPTSGMACVNKDCVMVSDMSGKTSCDDYNDCTDHGATYAKCESLSASPTKVGPDETVGLTARSVIPDGVTRKFAWGAWTKEIIDGAQSPSIDTDPVYDGNFIALDATYSTLPGGNKIMYFTPSHTGRLSSISVFVKNADKGVFAGVYNSSGTTLIAENNGFTTSSAPAWLTIKFAKRVNITAGTQYMLKLRYDTQYTEFGDIDKPSWYFWLNGTVKEFYFKDVKIMETGIKSGSFDSQPECPATTNCSAVWRAPDDASPGDVYKLMADVHDNAIVDQATLGQFTNSHIRSDHTSCEVEVEIGSPGWFQTKGGNIHSEWGLSSAIPAAYTGDKYVSLVLNSYPGIISYGSQTANFGSGTASGKGWLVGGNYKFDSESSNNKSLICGNDGCYKYFLEANTAGSDPIPNNTLTNLNGLANNKSYTVNGNLTIGSSESDIFDFGGRTNQFLVNGNVYINGQVYDSPASSGGSGINSGSIPIATNNDDEDHTDSANLIVGKYINNPSHGAGFRFVLSNNQVPTKNSIISNAILRVYGRGSSGTLPANVRITGEASANCAPYTSTLPDSRVYLNDDASRAVPLSNFPSNDWHNFDVTDALQDIVKQDIWVANSPRHVCIRVAMPGAASNNTYIAITPTEFNNGANEASLSFTWTPAGGGASGEGGVMVVASGNIYINKKLWQGTNVSSAPVVEGVYVADGKIYTSYDIATGQPDSSAKRFSGKGIFVGNGGISLNRDLSDVDNLDYPDEYFIYDPSLLIKFRDFVGRPQRFWLEVAP